MQTQPPVPPVSSTRIRRNDWCHDHHQSQPPLKGAGRVVCGGLHRAAIGTSTKDETGAQAALQEFNRELQAAVDGVDWSQPF